MMRSNIILPTFEISTLKCVVPTYLNSLLATPKAEIDRVKWMKLSDEEKRRQMVRRQRNKILDSSYYVVVVLERDRHSIEKHLHQEKIRHTHHREREREKERGKEVKLENCYRRGNWKRGKAVWRS